MAISQEAVQRPHLASCEGHKARASSSRSEPKRRSTGSKACWLASGKSLLSSIFQASSDMFDAILGSNL